MRVTAPSAGAAVAPPSSGTRSRFAMTATMNPRVADVSGWSSACGDRRRHTGNARRDAARAVLGSLSARRSEKSCRREIAGLCQVFGHAHDFGRRSGTSWRRSMKAADDISSPRRDRPGSC